MTAPSFDTLAALAPRLGVTDTPCLACGPDRRSPANRARKVLRIWRYDGRFIGYCCVRCGTKGFALAAGMKPGAGGLVHVRVAEMMADRDREAAVDRIAKARWLWAQSRPMRGTVAATYLCDVRGYDGLIPETLRFLAGGRNLPPAMVAAFGLATEPEPGRLAIAEKAVRAVHLTRLRPDGLGKAGDPSKLMVGRPSGSPIVLAPPNDLLGLAITEGIEDGLSIYAATGLGTWAAGSASHLPALADAVPAWVDAITVVADADSAGQAGAVELARRLRARGLHVEAGSFPEMRRAA